MALYTANMIYIGAIAIPLALIAWFLIESLISYRRLAHIPGPALAAWSTLWIARAHLSKQSHLQFYNASKKYGSIVRVGPNALITSDPELLRRMSAVRSPYTRSAWYSAFKLTPDAENTFSTADEEAHTKRRAQVYNGYTGERNSLVEPIIDRNVLRLLGLIRKKYVSAPSNFRPMDLAQKMQFFTLDTILEIGSGAPMGDLEHDTDIYQYLKISAGVLGYSITMASIPTLRNIVQTPWVANLIAKTIPDDIGFGALIGFAKGKVKEHYSTDSKGGDTLSSFRDNGLGEKDAVAETVALISAGTDSTAGALRGIMLYTITSPRIYQALKSELTTATLTAKISSPIITNSEALALPYLQAVIKEGLRIWPPATGPFFKLVPPEGDTVNGLALPGGTVVGTNIWALFRDKEIFGDDVEVFRPERWLLAKGEELARMERTVDWVFGSGKYSCLGKRIALIEINKVIVEMMRNFEWVLMDPTNPAKFACHGFFTMTDFWVMVTERNPRGE